MNGAGRFENRSAKNRALFFSLLAGRGFLDSGRGVQGALEAGAADELELRRFSLTGLRAGKARKTSARSTKWLEVGRIFHPRR